MGQFLARLSFWEMVALLGGITVAVAALFFPVATVRFQLMGMGGSESFTLVEGYRFLGIALLLGALGSLVALWLDLSWFRRIAVAVGGFSLLVLLWVFVDVLSAQGLVKQVKALNQLGGNLLGVDAGASLAHGALFLLLGGVAALVGGLQALRQTA